MSEPSKDSRLLWLISQRRFTGYRLGVLTFIASRDSSAEAQQPHPWITRSNKPLLSRVFPDLHPQPSLTISFLSQSLISFDWISNQRMLVWEILTSIDIPLSSEHPSITSGKSLTSRRIAHLGEFK